VPRVPGRDHRRPSGTNPERLQAGRITPASRRGRALSFAAVGAGAVASSRSSSEGTLFSCNRLISATGRARAGRGGVGGRTVGPWSSRTRARKGPTCPGDAYGHGGAGRAGERGVWDHAAAFPASTPFQYLRRKVVHGPDGRNFILKWQAFGDGRGTTTSTRKPVEGRPDSRGRVRAEPAPVVWSTSTIAAHGLVVPALRPGESSGTRGGRPLTHGQAGLLQGTSPRPGRRIPAAPGSGRDPGPVERRDEPGARVRRYKLELQEVPDRDARPRARRARKSSRENPHPAPFAPGRHGEGRRTYGAKQAGRAQGA